MPSMTIEHADGSGSDFVQRIDIGDLSTHSTTVKEGLAADLRWSPGTTKIISGTITSSLPQELKVS